ncbi:MAG: Ni/Fe-hydrogenase cytochrome b subunit [Phycisphaerales bacterium]
MTAAVAMPLPRLERTWRADAKPTYFTPGVWVVAAVAALGGLVWLYRMAFGLGSTTHLSNAYPWGIWIGIDVATGVALAAGGFTTAFLAHVLHRERYHALVRPALLTAALGYTFVAIGVMTDLGRFWAMWHVMLPSMWQPNSALFEVALCVMTYLSVLYIEFMPVVCERFIGRVHLPGPARRLDRVVDRALRLADRTLDRFMTVFIVAGIMLSCMHQSSLGTLMVIAQDKVHVLWQTPAMPLLFLLSAFAVGYPMVIFESIIAHRSFGLRGEQSLLADLARFIPYTLGLYLVVKVADLVTRGAVGHVFEGSPQSRLFLAEVVLGVVLPLVIFLSPRRRAERRWLFLGASLVVFGVAFNRLNVFLLAYTPLDPNARYTPAWTEIVVTAGFIAMTVLIYRFVALNLPVIEQLEERKTSTASTRPERPMREPVAGDARSGARPSAAGAASAAAALLLAVTTLAAPSATATPPVDRRATYTASGQRVPDVVVLDQIAACYGSVTFDHSLHVGMVSIERGCATCHHHERDRGAVQTCRSCHATVTAALTDDDKPGLRGAYHRQCLSCHKEWSGENACGSCHVDATSLVATARRPRPSNNNLPQHAVARATYLYQTSRPGMPVVTFHHDDHAQRFGLKCADCHGGSECGQCHGPRAERPVVKRQESCFGCHAEKRCVSCHNLGERERFDHAKNAGWRLRPGHDDLACATCHGVARMPGTPTSESCRTCHAELCGDGSFDHGYATGVELYGDHAMFECIACHAGGDLKAIAACDKCHAQRAIAGTRAVGSSQRAAEAPAR